MKYLSYGAQTIDKSDVAAVIQALRSNYLTQGPKIEEFEQKLSHFTGAKYSVVVNSGTAALHTAYAALGVSAGDEIITSPMTFAATSNAALYLGATPVFVDIDPATGCIDPESIERKITKKTKVVTVIDYGGQPAAFKKVRALAKKHNLKIVDDACHALGASYHGHTLGDGYTADVTVLSFHPVKHITTGEGGAIQTNEKAVYERALQFRTHGITKNSKTYQFKDQGPWYHEMQMLGFNYRLTDILAVLGISQMKKLRGFLKRRRAIAAHYDKAFKNNPYFTVPPRIADTVNAYHLYTIRLTDDLIPLKAKLVEQLQKKGIGTQVHYIPVYYHPYYRQLGYKIGSCLQAERFYQRTLSIPMYPKLTDANIKRVAQTILKTCKQLSAS